MIVKILKYVTVTAFNFILFKNFWSKSSRHLYCELDKFTVETVLTLMVNST